MNTAGMSFMGLDWLNRAADGAICETCGYVHQFVGDGVQWLSRPRRAQPPPTPRRGRRFGGGQ